MQKWILYGIEDCYMNSYSALTLPSLPGETTDKGRTTTYALGQRLRHLYVDQLRFLPTTLNSTEDFYLRCTMIPRALDAMQQSFAGLYPSTARSASLVPPIIHTRIWPEENLTDNSNNCKRYGLLYKAFGERAAGRWNDSPEMAHINKKIGKYMTEENSRVKVDSHPRLSGMMDTINATRAHGPATKLPNEFYDPQLLANIDKIVVDEWFAGYKENTEFRRLGKGQMVGDITQMLTASALGQDKQPIRFALTGAHDTTLAGFLASLGAFEDEPWPKFTSHVAVELFRRKSSASSSLPQPESSNLAPAAPRTSWFASLFGGSSQSKSPSTVSQPNTRKPLTGFSPSERETIKDYYVRIRYNDRPVTIPGCRKPGRHFEEGGETFCTLEAFKQIADAFTPNDWKKECRERLEQRVDFSKVVPAGYPAGEGPEN